THAVGAFFGNRCGDRLRPHPVYLPDEQKHGEGNDQKLEDRIQEVPVGDNRSAGRFRLREGWIGAGGEVDEQVFKIHPSDNQSDRRHQDVVHERRHNLSEGRTDDQTDRKIQYVAADGKLFEFLQHRCSSVPSNGPYGPAEASCKESWSVRGRFWLRSSARLADSNTSRVSRRM